MGLHRVVARMESFLSMLLQVHCYGLFLFCSVTLYGPQKQDYLSVSDTTKCHKQDTVLWTPDEDTLNMLHACGVTNSPLSHARDSMSMRIAAPMSKTFEDCKM